MECPNCHHWNEAGARFCEECGFDLTSVAASPSASVSVTGGVAIDPDAIPDPAPQSLVPAAPPEAPAFEGPRLFSEKTKTIFKLGDSTLIGREEPSAQIDFDGYDDGKFISHRHAQISKREDGYYLEDLGSTNATRVNGMKLSQGQAQALKDGDKVRFGKIELTFMER